MSMRHESTIEISRRGERHFYRYDPSCPLQIQAAMDWLANPPARISERRRWAYSRRLMRQMVAAVDAGLDRVLADLAE